MSGRVGYATGAWPTSDSLARRAVIIRWLAAAAVIATACLFVAAVFVSGGSALVAVLGGIALMVWPRSGLYALFAAALLLEEWGIAGLDPITAETHFFQNVSGYSAVPLRLSLADLLAIFAMLAWV